jgi:hypothetical protein
MKPQKIKIEFILPDSKVVSSPYDFGDYKTRVNTPFYRRVKLMELNPSFCRFLAEVRRELKIDSKDLFENILLPFVKDASNDIIILAQSDKYLSDRLLEQKDINVEGILKDLEREFGKKEFYKYISSDVNALALVEIILFESVRVKKGKEGIQIYREIKDQKGHLDIRISKKIKRTQLIEYIKDNFDEIIAPFLDFKSVDPETEKFTVSERDLKIIELRYHQGKAFKDIAEELEVGGESPIETCKQCFFYAKEKAQK